MKQTLAGARWVGLAVAGITLLGFALRLARYQQSVLGDELSTLYIVDGRSLSEMVGYVSGDAEISPPLYFLLSWLTTKLGSAPELVRLPSLIAGTLSIPLTYLVGARAVGRPAGLVAAAVMALSPFMIFYSADGRGYAVALALLLGSTLAMLVGVRTGRSRWWVAYGALSLLAMYTHYTAAFVLIAQLGWLLWAHPDAHRPALIANAFAAAFYLPWLPGLLDDAASPTTDVLYLLQGSGLDAKSKAVLNWAAGYPYRPTGEFPGLVSALLAGIGFVAAAIAGLVRHLRAYRGTTAGEARPLLVSPGVALIVVIALSNFAIELAILVVTGNDLLGARNLVTSSGGLALLIGTVLTSAGPMWGAVCTALVVGSFGFGAAKTLSVENQLTDFRGASAFIDAESRSEDVIVDLTLARGVTPVPLTPLDAYLDRTGNEFRPGLAEGEPPFLPLTPVPDTAVLIEEAIRSAENRSLLLVAGKESLVRDGDRAIAIRVYPPLGGGPEDFALPRGSTIAAESAFDGLDPFEVVKIEVGAQ